MLTGAELAALPAGEYPDAVERATVFARVAPEQKLRLVEAFQSAAKSWPLPATGSTTPPHCARPTSG